MTTVNQTTMNDEQPLPIKMNRKQRKRNKKIIISQYFCLSIEEISPL
jgi:hypothetical protein